LINTTELKSLSRQSLAEMAREFNISGRSSMSKDDLIAAIRKSQDAARKKKPTKKGADGDAAEPAESASQVLKAKESAKPSRSRTSAAKTRPEAKPESKPEPTSSDSSDAGKPKPGAKPKSSRSSVAAKSKSTPAKSSGAPSNAATKPAAEKPKPAEVNSKKSDRKRVTKPVAQAPAVPTPPPAEPAAKTKDKPAAKPASKVKKPAAKTPAPPPAPVSAKSKLIREEMRRRSQAAMQNKDLSTGVLVAGSAVRGSSTDGSKAPLKDRIVLVVRDSYWLQADWEITRAAVERVRVSMNEKWHKAVPVLRLLAVGDASSNRAEQQLRDIAIHGGVNTWFIDVDNPPSRFRVVVGYLAENDRFFPLCRSNIVETPKPDAVHRLDRHWRDIAEDYERIYSLSGGYEPNSSADLKDVFEERLQRQMPSRSEDSSSSDTDAALDRHRSLPFEVDAELIVFGSTIPGATVLLSGEPVKLREDGTFTVRVALPDKRQVLPVIAQSRDSMRQRTTVIAVERNTKVMEAVDRDQNF